MRRWLFLVLFVVAACSITSSTRSSGDHPLRLTTTGTCPKTLAGHDGVRNSGAGLGGRLVPGTPTALLICRYSPVGGLQAPSVQHGVLYGSARLDESAALVFARLLNAIPTDHGEHGCPPDSSRYDVLVFAVRGRPDVDVWSLSTGCWSFTNGARTTGYSSTALEEYMQQLERAVPGQLVVQAGADGSRGTIRGRLLAAGMSTVPVPGKVTVSPGDLPPIDVSDDGVFVMTLAPGTYTLSGRSPRYNDGRGECRGQTPVHVVGGGTVTANVYCVEK